MGERKEENGENETVWVTLVRIPTNGNGCALANGGTGVGQGEEKDV